MISKPPFARLNPSLQHAYEVVSVSAIIVSFLCQSISVLLVCLTSLSCTSPCVEVQRIDTFCTLFLGCVMEHPYNIQPIGNLYRKNKRGKVSAALPTRRVDLLGVQISKLDDSVLSNNLFGFFNARDLAKISPVAHFSTCFVTTRSIGKHLYFKNLVARSHFINLGKIHIR